MFRQTALGDPEGRSWNSWVGVTRAEPDGTMTGLCDRSLLGHTSDCLAPNPLD